MFRNATTAAVSITNPLVKYRSLVSSGHLLPDQNQYRLAIHLEKLYDRLKDYEPTIPYHDRLRRRQPSTDDAVSVSPVDSRPAIVRLRQWSSFIGSDVQTPLSLIRSPRRHEEALHSDAPKGLLVHGEVGTGKSLLIDLFAESLPTHKKRRWHFNNFMLRVIHNLEQLRISRKSTAPANHDAEAYSVDELARQLSQNSPILFLDEFQLPDRAAAKILSHLMTAFFRFGGVLIATSNRMPEDLATAAGVEFLPYPSRFQTLTRRLGLTPLHGSRSQYPRSEFADFLDLLKGRCDVWDLRGARDYRRGSEPAGPKEQDQRHSLLDTTATPHESEPGQPIVTRTPPQFFFTTAASGDLNGGQPLSPHGIDAILRQMLGSSSIIPWRPSYVTVFGRKVLVPRQLHGVSYWSFEELCTARLGSADYVTLASTYHTFVVEGIPTLTLDKKNEARRFITLLDALYESRCRLLVVAETGGPDGLFFPDVPPARAGSGGTSSELRSAALHGSIATNTLNADKASVELNDSTYAETFSEAYQDVTAPFRPNISSYKQHLPQDALEDDPPNRRASLADSHDRRSNLFTGNGSPAASIPNLDFSRTSAFTGEDERFAYRRAESRLWEMCSKKWWGDWEDGRGIKDVERWWRPVDVDLRSWEGPPKTEVLGGSGSSSSSNNTISEALSSLASTVDENQDSRDIPGRGSAGEDDSTMFKHGASPFRVSAEPPPKFNWTHAWGTVKWGKRAGNWGKGVDGVAERRAKKDS